MTGSPTGRHETPVLLQALIDEASHFHHDLHAHTALRTTDLLGLIVGRYIERTARAEHGQAARLELRHCAEMLGGIEGEGGGRFSIAAVSKRCIQLLTTHCPFTDGAVDAPHLCEVAIGAMGTLAARNFGYGKVELRRRMTTADCCEIWIHTDPDEAVAYPGHEYRRIDDRICSAAGREEAQKPPGLPVVATRPPARDARAAGVSVIVARSEAMRAVLRAIEIVAPAHTTVLITGETGVGKELVARRLHALSPCTAGPFVAVNCGAIPDNLVESALFGHEKGAFTGAHDRHFGYFERADGGTLFLDEIDALPLMAQTRLLRVLQESEFERVGGRRRIACNVRVIAACNSDLETAVAQGRFRRDLYYRVNVVGITIPPLRERREDIPPLIEHIFADMRRRHGMELGEISLGVIAELIAYDWPGNVRELENVIERSCLFGLGTRLTRVDLGKAARQALPAAAPPALDSNLRDHCRRAADQVEKNLLCEELKQARGSVPAVARRMGVTSRAVYLKLKRHDIDPATFRR